MSADSTDGRPQQSGASVAGARAVTVPGWPAPRGYADVMSARGRVIAIAGQVGWNATTMAFESDDFAEQTAQALRNVVTALRAADAGPEHLVRLTWYVTSVDEYAAARKAIGQAYREIIGRHYPAMSVVMVAGLLEKRAKVEIEATAVVEE